MVAAEATCSGEPTAEQRAAYTMTTANSGAVVPTEIMDEIVELMEADAPLYADAYHTNFAHICEIVQHTGHHRRATPPQPTRARPTMTSRTHGTPSR